MTHTRNLDGKPVKAWLDANGELMMFKLNGKGRVYWMSVADFAAAFTAI